MPEGDGIMILPTRKPDMRTYLSLCASRHSLSRFMTNQVIAGSFAMRGVVLDIGGEPRSAKSLEYKSLFSGYDSWLSLNVDPARSPDFVCDCNNPLPFEDGRFDHVVSISALEHIRNIDLAVAEIVRITKPGGLIVLAVPFLFAVHGDPDDYHRPTASWWQDTLKALGICEERQKIYPLCWDPLSSALSLIDNFWPAWVRRLFRPFILLPGLLFSFQHAKDLWRKLSLPVAYVVVAER